MMIRVIGAFLAILSFAIMLETPKKYIVYAGAVGAIGWFVYLFAGKLGAKDVLATFLSALTIAFVSHIFARVFKTPVTGFLIAGILPTVPGAGMFHIGYYLFQSNMEMTGHYISSTLQLAGVIAAAIFIVDAGFRVFQRGWKQSSLQYHEKRVDKSTKIV